MSSSGSFGSSWEQQASLERTFELRLGGDKGVTLARGWRQGLHKEVQKAEE